MHIISGKFERRRIYLLLKQAVYATEDLRQSHAQRLLRVPSGRRGNWEIQVMCAVSLLAVCEAPTLWVRGRASAKGKRNIARSVLVLQSLYKSSGSSLHSAHGDIAISLRFGEAICPPAGQRLMGTQTQVRDSPRSTRFSTW